jgi:hypothetical protein
MGRIPLDQLDDGDVEREDVIRQSAESISDPESDLDEEHELRGIKNKSSSKSSKLSEESNVNLPRPGPGEWIHTSKESGVKKKKDLAKKKKQLDEHLKRQGNGDQPEQVAFVPNPVSRYLEGKRNYEEDFEPEFDSDDDSNVINVSVPLNQSVIS